MSAIAVISKTVLLVRTGRGTLGAILQTFFTKIFIQVLGVGTGLLSARALGPDGRGILAAVILWPQLLSFASSLGLPSSVTYSVKAKPGQAGHVVIASSVLIAIAGCVAAAIGAAIMPIMAPNLDAADLHFARLLLLTTPIVSIPLVLQPAAEATADFQGSNSVRAISTAGTFIAIAALVTAGKLTPHSSALAYTLPIVPVAGWLFLRLARRFPLGLRGFFDTARPLYLYGLRCYPIDLLNCFAGYAGHIFVVAYLRPSSIGLFAVSFSISRLVETLYMPIATVLLPTVAAESQSRAVETTTLAARLHVLITLGAVVPLALIAPEALSLFYGAAFAEAASITRLLLVQMLLWGTAMILCQAFMALGRPAIPILMHVLQLGLSTSVLFVLTPRWDAEGAAAGLVVTAAAMLVFMVACHRLVLAAPLRCFVFRRADLLFLRSLLQRHI